VGYKVVIQMKKIIHELELSLLNYPTRQSREHLNEVIADEFVEFGSSGKVYNKQETLDFLTKESEKKFEIEDFKVVELSKDAMLAMYKITIDEDCSLRSSVWKLTRKKWQILFHQGTKF
jgi:hypothetical protein